METKSDKDIAIFTDIFDKKYSNITTIYLSKKFVKSVALSDTIVEINGRYFYKFNDIQTAKGYLDMILKKLNWKR